MASTALPASASTPSSRRGQPRAIANWLLSVAALVFGMIVVGGITRLTESGLSIVEWAPVSGTLPPIGEAAWQAEFDAYKATPQYIQVNTGMSLAEFKNIYFWEYVHRLLGRVIGLVFALPFAWFAIRRAIPAGYGWRLTALLVLGGLQGFIGWWMVASGLVNQPEVSHLRLAVHLLNALLILAALVWTALDLLRLDRDASARPARMSTLAVWAFAVLALQMLFGAYVAGLEAGYAFNSWPLMGDSLFPSNTPMLEPALRNLVDNPVVVQFVHRWLAFVVAAVLLLVARAAWTRGAAVPAVALVGALTVQILLGIMTLLTGVALPIAAAHQGVAAILLACLVWCVHRTATAREMVTVT
ncbi:MAG TPA: COX15/CtaA family protein [Sphingomonadaceae bacterium]|nr:COX15/CtaA family protein [Sphingomonadaceae bacterium]